MIVLLTENHNLVTLFTCILRQHHIEIQHTNCWKRLHELSIAPNCIAVILDFPEPDMEHFELWKDAMNQLLPPIFIMSTNDTEVKRVILQQQAHIQLLAPLAVLTKQLQSTRYLDNDFHSTSHVYELAPGIIFDLAGHRIIRNDCHILLSSTEFKIVYLLIKHINRTLTTEEIIDLADLISPSNLYIHIKNIRDKIEDDPRNPSILVTIRGKGYKLKAAASS
ncbi:winged helix-turn-helix domain-containing protein [Paenibacillus assamensis]|uniref:winged helix-turn-helix domain-containing protein n=1 Tax=Paenibacillus assamensis TaxID=311244 RepID=UPI00041B8FD3|nr:winged helix-turn-helix domain-containing protein [Paenibacillus assamensis]